MAKAGVTVTYTDKGLKKLMETLKELGKLRATVGVQGRDTTDKYPDGTAVSTVARANEYGTQYIPARGFMRRAVKMQGRTELPSVAAEAMGDVVSKGGDAVSGMEAVGNVMAEAVVEQIQGASSWATPDAPSTVEEKGTNRPLRDTGKLRKAISWAVREGRSVKSEGKPT